MDRLDWRSFEKLTKSFFESELLTKLLEHMSVPLKTGESHKFDLVSSDQSVVIECKSHTWTESGNYPSGKVTDAKHSIDLLHKSDASRKIIVFQDDPGLKETLLEVFVRRNRRLLPGIEVWRYLDGRFEPFANFPVENKDSEVRANKVASFILSKFANRGPAPGLVFDVELLNQSTGISSNDIFSLAPTICERISKTGTQVKFDRGRFWLGLVP